MPLSNEERDRIREEEWVRLQAREDFYKANPGIGFGDGSFGALRWRQRRNPIYLVAIVAVVGTFVLLASIAERINWNHVLP